MQVKKIASLCAVAFAAMSGQANAAMSAAEQTIVNDAVTNGRVIFISGASATQKGFTGIIAKMFTGTPIRFANTTADSKDFEAVAGVLGADAGAWSGKNVIVIDRVKGGSVFGVDPVARNQKIESLKVTSASCGGSGAGTSSSPYVCDVTLEANGEFMAPDAGISDVAPALFVGPINTEGEIPAGTLTEAELGELTATPIYSLAFGVPVTSNVGASVSFNKALVSAIMAGNIGTWDQVDPSESGDMIVCRRVPGSGTQAVDNLYFGNFPCGGENANTPADRTSSLAAVWNNAANTYTVNGATGGVVVIENSTSGDVRNCLNKAVEAKTALPVGSYTTYGTKDRSGAAVTVSFKNGVDHKAVGVLSMDSLKDSKTTGKWQFRSLNGAGTYTWDNTANEPVATGTGIFPTLANLIDGTWDLQGWISFNIPSRTTGDKADAINKFLVSAQDPAILGSITDLKKVAAAIPGGEYSGAQVMRAQYLGNSQCAPLNRNY
ncbi:hypothetical protein [Ferribacterium limneticum]|uniref:hypothetical protein n=1 Tax=Ferribacterium limneticum TaxID=76259 RepID=UPI001CFC3009|nr:hypothetical protein [Ferribacterium limneticum]UCV17960.1 hypothetical protein KI610_14215 [Ferribacterium limneticum]